jgi:hypothetical protein
MATVIIVCAVKLFATTLVPLKPSWAWSGDFYNWVSAAGLVQVSLSQGRLPSLARFGVYLGFDLLLAPFYWLWSVLPIPHPPLAEMIGAYSTEEYLLVLIMKIPILVSDLLAGMLTALLVRRATQSNKMAQKAFLIWYMNPFNVFWMYYFGGYDVVSAVVVLLAAVFGNSKQWFRSGFCLAVASLLRVYPFLLLPAFMLYGLRDNLRSSMKILASFLAPVSCAFASQALVLGSFDRLVAVTTTIPLFQYWLLRYYGYSITPGLFGLTPFLLVVQFYMMVRYWKNPSCTLNHVTMGTLLVLFSTTYYEPYHFIWVSPFLTAYYVTEKDRLQLFVLTFLFACLYVAGYLPSSPLYDLRPLLGGLLYGTVAMYLLKLNVGAASPQIRRVFADLRSTNRARSLWVLRAARE